MGPVQSIDDLFDLIRRRKLVIAAILLLGAVLSVMFALSRPKVFEASAVIQVEGPMVNDANGVQSSQSARMLQTIEQRLTTRENLLAVIERHKLFDGIPGLSADQKIWSLRQSISFQTVAAATGQAFGVPTAVSALVISTRFGDAEQTARIANDFAQSVLDMSVERKVSRARDTYAFFTEEEARLGAEISALESELTAYKNANIATLSQGEQDDRTAIDAELRGMVQQLLAVRAERDAVQAKARLRETDRRRIDELNAQESLLSSQQAALEQQRDALDLRSAATPEVEQTLNAYDRRLQQLQNQFDIITVRRAEAETALRLEDEQHSERFSLLERAVVPSLPSSSGRKKIALAGLLGSMIAAFGFAFLLDMLHPVIRSASQMERQLNIRPVITIPDLKLNPKPRSLLSRLFTRRQPPDALQD
ncbi:MAG: hypothetical protein A2X69_05315 [Rhodobacteraceae bacterium GWF1_65_7]|nr:MAG: hypothetical protein A2X69_05315 [Rhodobacteraceae bacterium GWF1_65_7]